MILRPHIVTKPWGRADLPAPFSNPDAAMVGEIWFEAPPEQDLPLLIKYIFTSARLSVQVHPNDAQAQARGERHGKTECWYVVAAEPGATLGIGTRAPLDAAALRAAALSGDIEALMDWKTVAAGDFFVIPAGTVHAIGAGITLVEVQQNIDLTYRLYDYGRPRPLHLDDGVAVAVAAPYPPHLHRRDPGVTAQLLAGDYFDVWVQHGAVPPALPQRPRWIVPLDAPITVNGEALGVGACAYCAPDTGVAVPDAARALIAVARPRQA